MLLVWFCLHFYALLSLLEYDEQRGRSGTTSRTFASFEAKAANTLSPTRFQHANRRRKKWTFRTKCRPLPRRKPFSHYEDILVPSCAGLRRAGGLRSDSGSPLKPGRWWAGERSSYREISLPLTLCCSPIAPTPDYFRRLGVAEGLTPGVAVGLASGVAVGIAVGDGSGIAPGVERPVMSGVGVGCGVTRRIPDGIPGAFGLASLAPFLFGAGPVVDGAVVDAPRWLAPSL